MRLIRLLTNWIVFLTMPLWTWIDAWYDLLLDLIRDEKNARLCLLKGRNWAFGFPTDKRRRRKPLITCFRKRKLTTTLVKPKENADAPTQIDS